MRSISHDASKFKNVIITCPFSFFFLLILRGVSFKLKLDKSAPAVLWDGKCVCPVCPVCVCVLARDLSWRDLDLIVERAPVPQYQKGPLDVALPLLYGILLGFGGTLFAGLAVLLVFLHVSWRKPARMLLQKFEFGCWKMQLLGAVRGRTTVDGFKMLNTMFSSCLTFITYTTGIKWIVLSSFISSFFRQACIFWNARTRANTDSHYRFPPHHD